MSSTVEQIKDRVDIIDLVSGYMSLQRAGTNMKARCPFHSERSPSFTVSPARQSYHCFGCGEHGDIFTFVEKMEGVDFKGALKILAERAGVEIKYDGPKKSKEELDEREQMFACMSSAAEFYYQRLQENSSALEYLKGRGFNTDTITTFQIGFAPDDWHAVESILKTAGFKSEIIEKVGLIIKGDKSYYDRFRSRIMFPIRDTAGRVVAFSGRIFGNIDDKTAKYINSPETELYSKSKVLYGFDMAKQSIRKNDFAILVEGQMDLVACHQALYHNTVAISGTALTAEHCKMLGRMSKNIVLALDADQAGIKAAGRSAIVALTNGFDVKVARLPEGKDPADVLLEEGREAWKSIIKNSKHIVEFLLDVYSEQYSNDERKFKKKVEEVVLPFVVQIQSKIDQDHFVKLVAGRIGVTESTLLLAMAAVKPVPTEPRSQEEQLAKTRSQDYRRQFSPIITLASIIVWQESLKDPAIDLDALKERIVAIVGKEELLKAIEQVTNGDLMYVESMYGREDALNAVLSERLAYLRQSMLRSKRLKLTQELLKAENSKDKLRVKELQQEINKLNSELEKA